MIYHGDCLEVMGGFDDNSIDAIVTDPPYGLKFMGKKWDYEVPSVEIWEECLRVLKPGGHLLSFGGTRTYHRMAVNIEDGGFEIRDMVAWVYGSGFPKSHNISKAIDKMAGVEREVVGYKHTTSPDIRGNSSNGRGISGKKNKNKDRLSIPITAPATPEAQQWDGWGTALKPAHEPICVARKPMAENTIAANVLEWGTGGINIDGCRVEYEDTPNAASNPKYRKENGYKLPSGIDKNPVAYNIKKDKYHVTVCNSLGRFPANFCHDGSDEVLALFPQSNGGAFPKKSNVPTGKHYDGGWGNVDNGKRTEMGEGSAARFFYCAKASKRDRDEGLDDRNTHPTVKPTDLMRYLCRLISPPGGIVLDPFMGSGSTGKGAILEGFDFVGIELEGDSFEIARRRIEFAEKQWKQLSF